MGKMSIAEILLQRASGLESGKWTPVGYRNYRETDAEGYPIWHSVRDAPITLAEAHKLKKMGAVVLATRRTFKTCECCGQDKPDVGGIGHFHVVAMPSKTGLKHEGK
jgi:hypothetical protein